LNHDRSEIELVVLSGPSGSGKTTVVERLLNHPELRLMKAISATTRPPRPHETDGESYYFLSQADFDRRRKNGEFVEWAEVHHAGNWYGTLHSELQRAADTKQRAFLEIDVQGALEVMKQYPQAITIFLKTPDEEVFEQRLRSRGTETEEVIQRRLQTAREELPFADQYQYQVTNDRLEQTVREISQILLTQEKKQHAG